MLKSKLWKGVVSVLAAASVFAGGYIAGNNTNDLTVSGGYDLPRIEQISESDIVSIGSDVDASSYRLEGRDYSRYSYTPFNLSGSGLTFYNRLIEKADQYLMGNKSGIKVNSRGEYAMEGVAYSDIGVSRSDAYDIVVYFLCNNPQYYFLRPIIYNTSTNYYVGMYSDFILSEDRVSVTENLFNTLDSWIYSCTDDEVTDYQKELSICSLVEDKLKYSRNSYDQSLYSSVIMGDTVCAGYSALFIAMCNAAGLECTAVYNDTHIWNAVNLNGQWYLIDPTWCDLYSTDVYYNVCTTTINNLKIGSAHEPSAFSYSHMPVISLSDFSPSVYDVTGSNASIQAPYDFTYKYLTDDKILVEWKGASDISQYELQIYSAVTGKLVTFMNTYTSIFTLSNVKAFGDVTLKVRSVVGSGRYSIYSDWVSFTVGSGNNNSSSNDDATAGSSDTTTAYYQPPMPQDSDSSGSFTSQAYIATPYDFRVDFVDNKVIMHWKGDQNTVNYGIRIATDAAFKNTIIKRTPIVPSALSLSNINAYPCIYVGLISSVNIGGATYDSNELVVKISNGTLSIVDSPSAKSVVYNTPVSSTTTSSVTTATPVTTTTPVVTTTPVPVVTHPSAITGLCVSSRVSNAVVLAWDKQSVDKYELQISTVPTFNTLLISTSITSNTVRMRGVNSSRTYYLRVRAVKNVNGVVEYSDWSSLTF